MNTTHQISVFESPEMIRASVTMLCMDKLPRVEGDEAIQAREAAIDKLCWEMTSLQGKNFPWSVLVDKCSASIRRSTYEGIRQIRPEELANEVSSSYGGW